MIDSSFLDREGDPVAGRLALQIRTPRDVALGPMIPNIKRAYAAFRKEANNSLVSVLKRQFLLADGTVLAFSSQFGVDAVSISPPTVPSGAEVPKAPNVLPRREDEVIMPPLMELPTYSSGSIPYIPDFIELPEEVPYVPPPPDWLEDTPELPSPVIGEADYRNGARVRLQHMDVDVYVAYEVYSSLVFHHVLTHTFMYSTDVWQHFSSYNGTTYLGQYAIHTYSEWYSYSGYFYSDSRSEVKRGYIKVRVDSTTGAVSLRSDKVTHVSTAPFAFVQSYSVGGTHARSSSEVYFTPAGGGTQLVSSRVDPYPEDFDTHISNGTQHLVSYQFRVEQPVHVPEALYLSGNVDPSDLLGMQALMTSNQLDSAYFVGGIRQCILYTDVYFDDSKSETYSTLSYLTAYPEIIKEER